MAKDPRRIFNATVTMVAAVGLVVSLVLACSPANAKPYVGHTVFALWAILPPLYFWLEWNLFCWKLDESERDKTKHNHELARNLWLGLLAVVAVAFKIKVL